MSKVDLISTSTFSTEKLYNFKSQEIEKKLEYVEERLKDLPSVLDKETIEKMRNGDYEITLQEYTDLVSYRAKMSVLYGDNSASKLPSMLNGILGQESDAETSAKDFMEKLEEQGVNKETALKLYTALKSYSLIDNFKQSYVSAWI